MNEKVPFSIIVFFIIFVIIIMIGLTKFSLYENKKINYYKSAIGKTIVIGTDTLTIVKYNELLNEYILSNGISVDVIIVKKIYGGKHETNN